MGEASSKPTSFQIKVSGADRYILFLTMSAAAKCPVCNSGPFDTTEAIKLIRYGKAWDLFNLSDFENVAQADLAKLITAETPSELIIETDILRFVIDVLITRSYVLNVYAPVLEMLSTLLAIAKENNIKLNGITEENLTEKDTEVKLNLTYADLEAVGMILTAAKRCTNKFNLTNGTSVEHGTALDYPSTITTFNVFKRLTEQLGLYNFLIGKESVASYADAKEYTIDAETSKYLKDTIVSRSTAINFPQHKLASIISKL